VFGTFINRTLPASGRLQRLYKQVVVCTPCYCLLRIQCISCSLCRGRRCCSSSAQGSLFADALVWWWYAGERLWCGLLPVGGELDLLTAKGLDCLQQSLVLQCTYTQLVAVYTVGRCCAKQSTFAAPAAMLRGQ
jgi:hypothetical protein